MPLQFSSAKNYFFLRNPKVFRAPVLLPLSAFFNNFYHFRRCYDERLDWKMFSVACYKIGIIEFIFCGQCDLIENDVLFIGDFIGGFCFVKKNRPVSKTVHKSRDNVVREIEFLSFAHFPIFSLDFFMHDRNYLSGQCHLDNFPGIGIFSYERGNDYVRVKNGIDFFHFALLPCPAKRDFVVDFVKRPVLKSGFFRKVVCLFEQCVNFVGTSFVLAEIKIGNIIKGGLLLGFRKGIVHLNQFLRHRHLQNKNIYYLVYIKIKIKQQRIRQRSILWGAVYE